MNNEEIWEESRRRIAHIVKHVPADWRLSRYKEYIGILNNLPYWLELQASYDLLARYYDHLSWERNLGEYFDPDEIVFALKAKESEFLQANTPTL
ncbi:MAG: hypothetical protein HN416_14940 [Nitrospina sp.]|jgi:hypothetical protein|nr:hypothetical protein [Nitrospina sp.]